jgi:hypothetical protein
VSAPPESAGLDESTPLLESWLPPLSALAEASDSGPGLESEEHPAAATEAPMPTTTTTLKSFFVALEDSIRELVPPGASEKKRTAYPRRRRPASCTTRPIRERLGVLAMRAKGLFSLPKCATRKRARR